MVYVKLGKAKAVKTSINMGSYAGLAGNMNSAVSEIRPRTSILNLVLKVKAINWATLVFREQILI